MLRQLLNTFLLVALSGNVLTLRAQPPSESPVLYTQARSHSLKQSIRLPGSVESRTVSTVAGQVEGLVMRLPVREGDRVEKGQILAQLREDTLRLRLDAARAQLKEDEARRAFAELNLTRTRELLEEGIISRQELDDAQFELNAWEGRVERLRADIERLGDDLEHTTIRAPFTGVIVRKLAEVGEWVALGGDIVELLSLQDLEVRVEVPEVYYGRVSVGGWAPIEFDSLQGATLRAPIVAVIPRADSQARTFPIRLRLPSREKRIGVGMVAHVLLPVGSVYEAVIIPKDAVFNGPRGAQAYRITQDETVELISLEAGAGVGEWIEVRGRLEVGDRVVTRGNERLRPGQKVVASPQEYGLP